MFLVLIINILTLIWANSTALVLLARNTLGNTLQFGFHYEFFGYDIYFGEAFISAIKTCLCCSICFMNKKAATIIQSILATTLFLGIIISFIMISTNGNNITEKFNPLLIEVANPFSQIITIVALTPWTFVGYESISNSVSEFKFNKNKIFP